MWYELAPAEYAKSLRWDAERSDESAARMREHGTRYSENDAKHMDRQARRLRAMALLCDRSKDETAGDMNFLGLSSPSTPREAEDFIIAAIEAGAVPLAAE